MQRGHLQMLQNIKKRNEGFTIIEVLIVLAIAGLILLIVFLAVPALQRNARNTSRKTDVAAIGSALSNFMDNNNGILPNQVSDAGSTNTVRVLNSGNPGNYEQAKLGYYTTGGAGTPGATDGNIGIYCVGSGISCIGTSPAAPSLSPPGTGVSSNAVAQDTVVIIVGETCDSAGTGPGTISTRAIAIFYVIETGSGNGDMLCQQAA